MDKSSLARLAFWAFNMTAIRDAGMSWFGFSYTNPEWERMSSLSEAVTPAAFVRFILIASAVFIVIAALAIVCVFLPILTALYPDMSKLQPLPFSLLLAATALLSIGLGLPLSMRIASVMSADDAMRARLNASPADAALAGKVSHQLWRMTIIMCGLLVPGMLLWIAYDIQGGPIITALKWLAAGLMGASIFHAVASRKR